MSKYRLDREKYAALARQAAAEGCVLLKNDHGALPLRQGDKAAIFGRSAFHYYKSGLGSGGLVNSGYVTSIPDALKAEADITIDQDLLQVYEAWIQENPYDEGAGWGRVPWSQKEMMLSDAVVDAAKDADIALVFIGRTAGEDQDNKEEAGSYLLSDIEKDMIAKVSHAFSRCAVILNVGNIIDMKWVGETDTAAVLYVWQGGQEGGNGVVDVLTGRVNPCGKLADTIAENIGDYPSSPYFGNLKKNYYAEDIYVGYRYFETFAKSKVLYPFGYGLSYTSFVIDQAGALVEPTRLIAVATVTNTGNSAGKEVVQAYIKSPQGCLGKPERVLAGFSKTRLLVPGESEEISIIIPKYAFASYDDAGLTGHRSCYVLEAGTYELYLGNDVRNAALSGSFEEDFTILEKLEEACAPVEGFSRLKPEPSCEDSLTAGWENVPTRTVNPYERMRSRREAPLPYTGNQGYLLKDVYDGNVSTDAFISQLSDEDLICMFRGEGMGSSQVTPGTAGAFGGVTESLKAFGIPAACCADGPSGIRMDCGTKAFSLPNGTLLGCTFNLELVRELYRMTGMELRKNKIDTLLGPGINLHRSPLNGRNFEYISEDPLLTGKMGAAQIQGMEYARVTGTAKHFCANNQETNRQKAEAVVSERALRELYLRSFEIAVKEGKCRSLMTTYGPLNGIWTAGNYDLNTTILRKEWGFQGIVMTDWWAQANTEGEEAYLQNRAPMAAAQNDIYMCTANSSVNLEHDNVAEKLQSGDISRSDLTRNARNILTFIMNTPAMLHQLGQIGSDELEEMRIRESDDFSPMDMKYYEVDIQTNEVIIDAKGFDTSQGSSEVFGITLHRFGPYNISFRMKSELGPPAQHSVSLYFDNSLQNTINIQGTEGKWLTVENPLGDTYKINHYVKIYFGASGLDIDQIIIRLRE